MAAKDLMLIPHAGTSVKVQLKNNISASGHDPDCSSHERYSPGFK